jgi:Lon protease-like protein
VPGRIPEELPLFPLPIVLLPTEVMPLHIFEERYKTMIAHCLENAAEFGVIWLSDEGLKRVGCSAYVSEVLERMEDGRLNIVVNGGAPFRLLERKEHLPYPAGTVELLDDRASEVDPRVASEARERYAALLERVTDERPGPAELDALDSYRMAASVDLGLQVKQGLLELRSEQARLRLLARLLKSAIERLDVADRIAEHARGNGRVRIGGR